MKKSKRQFLSEKCNYCLRPFGIPLCAYNMTGKEKTIRDFTPCWDIKECPYEKDHLQKAEEQKK